jgi:hypothetical protein
VTNGRGRAPSPFLHRRTRALSFAKTLSGSLDGRPCVSEGSRRWRLVRGPESVSPALALSGGDKILGGHPERSGEGATGVSRWREDSRVLMLRCPPDVAVMQATDFGNREDHAERWRLDMPSIGSVLLEREVSAGPVIVREVRREDSPKVTLTENDDMVQALAADGADESLREGVLPWAARSGENFTDAMPFTRFRKASP